MEELSTELGAAPPPGIVAALSDAELERLTAVIRGARRDQTEELRQASEKALDHVPRVLRGIVKRIVGAT